VTLEKCKIMDKVNFNAALMISIGERRNHLECSAVLVIETKKP